MSMLTQYIELTLGEQTKLALPGLGTFRIDRLPARLDKAKGLIYPPRRQIRFNPGNAADDGILRRLYMTGEGTPEEQSTVAAERMRADIEELRSQLETGTPVAIGHLGMLVRDPWQSGKITFRSDASAQAFDLPATTLMTRERTPEEPQTSTTKTSTKTEIPTFVTPEEPTPPVEESVPDAEEEEEIVAEPEPQKPLIPETEPASVRAEEPTIVATATPTHETVDEERLERQRRRSRRATTYLIGSILALLLLGLIVLLVTRGGSSDGESSRQRATTEQVETKPAPVPAEPTPVEEQSKAPERETLHNLPVYNQGEVTPRHYIIIASLMTDKELENYIKTHDVKETFPEAGILMMRNGQRRIFSHALSDADEAVQTMREVRRHKDYSQSWIYQDK